MSTEASDTIPPGHHRLPHRWCFWHQKKSKRPSTVWSEGLTAAGRFSTVEGFWSMYAHMARPDAMTGSVDVMLFKDGVQPMWEDEANAKGGRLTFKVKKGMTSRLWEEILLAIVGNQIEGADLCGAVLSIRYTDDSISLWNRSADDEAATARMRDVLVRVIHAPSWLDIAYVRHGHGAKARAGQTGATGGQGHAAGYNSGNAGEEGPGDGPAGGWDGPSPSHTHTHTHGYAMTPAYGRDPEPSPTASSTATSSAPRASPPLPADDGSFVRLPLPSASRSASTATHTHTYAPAPAHAGPPPSVTVPPRGAWGRPAPSPMGVSAPAPGAPSGGTASGSPVAGGSPPPVGSPSAARPTGAPAASKRLVPSGAPKPQAAKGKAPNGEPGDEGWQMVSYR